MGRMLNCIGLLMGALIFSLVFLENADCRSLDEILAKIESAGSSIRTFQADFVQKKEVALFASTMTSKGKVIVRPPDLLIWKVLEPLKAFFFIDRGIAGTRDSNTGEVKRFPIVGRDDDASYGLFIRVITGSLKALKGSFRIELIAGDTGTNLRLRLKPIEERPGKGFDQILLGFHPDRFIIKEIILKENSGDKTTINLENARINRDISQEIPPFLREGRK